MQSNVVMPALQQGGVVSVQLRGHPVMQECEFFLLDDVAEMVEVLPEIVNRLPGEALTLGAIRPLCGGVPRSDVLPELFHVADGQQAGRKLVIEAQLLVEAPHPDGVLERLAVTADDGLCRTSGYGNHVEVELRRPRPVQAQLLFAKMPAFLQGAEVEEIEHDRLLDLVGVVAGQDHPGDMRLHEFDVAGRVGKRIRAQQGLCEACVES